MVQPLAVCNHSCCAAQLKTTVSRRHFLGGFLGTGLVFGINLAGAQSAQAQSNRAQALVLTCIDFRFVGLAQSFLSRQHLDRAYDWVALAGASLALTGFPHPAEAESFWDQLTLSRQLHNIKKVIILDHQDCGAYGSIHGQPFSDLEDEQKFHAQYLAQAQADIQRRHPDLAVELYFIQLTGEVNAITLD